MKDVRESFADNYCRHCDTSQSWSPHRALTNTLCVVFETEGNRITLQVGPHNNLRLHQGVILLVIHYTPCLLCLISGKGIGNPACLLSLSSFAICTSIYNFSVNPWTSVLLLIIGVLLIGHQNPMHVRNGYKNTTTFVIACVTQI